MVFRFHLPLIEPDGLISLGTLRLSGGVVAGS
jgi:hypothetical protein